MTKKFFLLTAFCLLLLGATPTLVSCSSKEGSRAAANHDNTDEIDPQIENFVEEMRKGINGVKSQMGDFVKDANVEIEGRDIVITVAYDLESQGVNPATVANISEDQVRSAALQSIIGADPSGVANIGKLLQKNNMRIVFNYEYGDGISRQAVFTGKDLTETDQNPGDIIGTLVQQLNTEYKSMAGTDGIISAHAYQKGNTIVNEIRLDAELEDNSQNRESIHQALLQEVYGSSMARAQALTLANAGVSMQFKYIGTNGVAIAYTFTPSELKEVSNL